MVTSVITYVTVCTVTYITPPVHWSFICGYLLINGDVIISYINGIAYYIDHKVNPGMGLVHETTDTEVCINDK